MMNVKSNFGDQAAVKQVKRVHASYSKRKEKKSKQTSSKKESKQRRTPLCPNQDTELVPSSSRHEAIQPLLPGSAANLTE